MANGTGQTRINPIQLAQLLRQPQVPLNVPGAGIVNAGNSLLQALALRKGQQAETARVEADKAARGQALSGLATALAGRGGAPQVASTEAGPAGIGAAPGATGPTVQPGSFNREALLQAALNPELPSNIQGPILASLLKGPGERRTLEDAAGRKRFVDTGEPVFSGVTPPPPEPRTPEGKLRADLAAGLINQAEFKSGFKRLAKSPITLAVGTQSTPGKLVSDRSALVDRHGEGSPEVQLFDKQIEKGTDFKEGQLRPANFANRMVDATQTLEGLAAEGYIPGQTSEAIFKNILGGNFVLTQLQQRANQAQENWVTANLRLESGAAIPPDEMKQEQRKWFPVAGDGPKTIAQKARARRNVEKGLIRSSQGAFGTLFPEQQELWEGQGSGATAPAPAAAPALAAPQAAPGAGDVTRFNDLPLETLTAIDANTLSEAEMDALIRAIDRAVGQGPAGGLGGGS